MTDDNIEALTRALQKLLRYCAPSIAFLYFIRQRPLPQSALAVFADIGDIATRQRPYFLVSVSRWTVPQGGDETNGLGLSKRMVLPEALLKEHVLVSPARHP